jgi:chromosome segregation protein
VGVFLKSIELLGFKSFADRTQIEFTQGISALLGPNGCGKSNVVDAIKWVLGEQATKSLRAERMEDVIFNGTDSRKALNVAEVTLTLTNEDGLLPLEISEVTVKRRLFRSGESEYLINNTPVKLRELRELFFDTGVGKTSYSIMEQGKIDQILSSRPDERRYLFEEAAGITKYKARGKEAERKLERTEENMRQVDSILTEVKRSYDTLKKQSEKTLSFRKIREERFDIEVDIQLLRLRSFLESKDKRQKQLQEAISLRDQTREQIDGINESLEENLDQVNSMESRLIEGQKQLYGLGIEKANAENQARILSERHGDVEQQLKLENGRRQSITQKIASLTKERTTAQEEVGALSESISQLERNIGEFEQSIEHAGGRIRENENTIKNRDSDIRSAEQEQSEIQEQLRGVTDVIVQELDQRLREGGYSRARRAEIESEITRLISTCLILIDGKTQLLSDLTRLSEAGDQERARTVESAAGGLQEVRRSVEDLNRLFVEYREATPAFLDEFTAPEGIITQKRDLDQAMERLQDSIRQWRGEIRSLNDQNRQLTQKIEQYRHTLEELRLNRVRMKTQVDSLQDAVRRHTEDIAEQEAALDDNRKKIEAAKEQLGDLSKRIDEHRSRRSALEAQESELSSQLKDLETTISTKNSDLAAKEQNLKAMMDDLGRTQAKVERYQMELAEINTEIRNTYENFSDQHSRDLREFEDRLLNISENAGQLRKKLSENKDRERSLGSVNLMAPEEFEEVKERYDFLSGQLSDLREAKEDLLKVTEEIRSESAERFTETYAKIRKNLHTIFRRLFGGGRAELKLLDPDNVLESGIEIYVQPPGKKLENIALLSGGERSMTAVALLFATFMVRPSPFCLLDEIDAALDESNVGRFADMLVEFSRTSQFIIITHNKKTVAYADTLLGVTMEDSGVSKVIAIRINDRETVNA